MKLKFLLSSLALCTTAAYAADENTAPVLSQTENAVETVELPVLSDSEFGFSDLSNDATFAKGTSLEGRRLDEWAKKQSPTCKFGGYIIGKYAWDSRGVETDGVQDGLNLRLVRLYVDGYVFRDFKYRLQLEVNGTPHIKDATLEWVHWKEFSIKAGQFKRAFTFEDPYNPFDVGVGDYSQLTKKLSGMNDRVGSEATNNGGRDLGVQFQGDLFPVGKDKHPLLHYQVGIFNGQGINTWDVDGRKDYMGTIQFRPIKDLYIGAFGWLGSFGVKEKQTIGGKSQNVIRQTDRNRFAAGVKYESKWTVRAEYARSYGYKMNELVWDERAHQYGVTSATAAKGNQADAFYATVGIPCADWLKAYIKYDLYRDYANWDDTNSIYTAALNFKFNKNLFFQAQYNYLSSKKNEVTTDYHQAWVEMYVRF